MGLLVAGGQGGRTETGNGVEQDISKSKEEVQVGGERKREPKLLRNET